MAEEACKGITISGSASYGYDPVPLYEAGKKKMACVLKLEALGQIQVSRVSFTSTVGGGGGATSFGGFTLSEAVNKYSITAQSGQAYFVDTLTSIGRHV